MSDEKSVVEINEPGTAIEVAQSPEDRRQYLAFLQAVIDRMAHNSASLKQWLIPLLVFIYGIACKGGDENEIAVHMPIWGILASLTFWMLDAYYLMIERAYRKKFNKAVIGCAKNYDMRIKKKHRGLCSWLACVFAVSNVLFYSAFIIVGIYFVYVH